MNNEPVTVCKMIIEETMKYKDEPVLHIRIEYPQFRHSAYQSELDRINEWYRIQAKELQRKYETELYREAAELYDYSSINQFPFHMYDAVSTYEITYNMNDVLSLYYDHYTYTGGAHGNTKRLSDTWNLATGCPIGMFQYTADPIRFQSEILDNIKKQIEQQIKNGENSYFDDYPTLIVEHFDPRSFYLTPQGIVIYYQQYDIAPYASGIPEFLIV